MGRITPWGWYWLIWAFGGFLIPELYALFTNTLHTLSWQIWGLEREDFAHPLDFAEWTPLHYALGAFFLIGLSWLFVHLVFGILR